MMFTGPIQQLLPFCRNVPFPKIFRWILCFNWSFTPVFLEKTFIFFLHISPHSPQHKGKKADLSWNANRSNRAGECDVSFKNCHRKVVTFLLAMPQIEIFRYLHICEGFFLLKHIQWFCQDISFCKGIVGGGVDSIKALARGPFGVPKVQYLFNIFFSPFIGTLM